MRWIACRQRDEQGTVVVLMGIVALVLVTITAFAVDLGVQRAARRDMQALADAVALDLARLLDGREAQEIVVGSANRLGIEAAKNASEARNEGSALGDDPTVTWTLIDLDVKGDPVKDLSGNIVPVTGADVPDGVYVTATTAVDFGFSMGSAGASRSALGISESSACYQLGSYAASINPSTSDVFGDLLKPILGASTMNLAGYNGLASANVSVLDLIHAPSIGVGTVDELLALPNLTVGDLFLASAYALTGQGKIAEAAVFNAAATSVVAPFVLNFNDVLAIDGSSDAVLNTHLNALDLLVGTVFLANGTNLLDVHNLQAELGSVGVTTGTELKIIEKARRWCTGFQTAGPETSQLTFKSNIKVQPNNSPLVSNGQVAAASGRYADGDPGRDAQPQPECRSGRGARGTDGFELRPGRLRRRRLDQSTHRVADRFGPREGGHLREGEPPRHRARRRGGPGGLQHLGGGIRVQARRDHARARDAVVPTAVVR